MVLLALWGFVPLVFFSFSTRQEYYVLPSLPPLSLLIARILDSDSRIAWQPNTSLALLIRRANIRCTGVLLAFGTIFAGGAVYFLLHMRRPAADADLASLLQQNPGDYAMSMGHFLLQQNPGDYAMSMGHFLDLNAQALGLFRVPLAIAALSLFMGPLVSLLLRRRAKPHAATLALAAGAFGFLLAAHLGLRIFAPVLSSQQLAAAIAPQVRPDDLIVLHQEYEYGSTLGFYLQRPSYAVADGRPVAVRPIHILTDASYHGTVDYGRSSNLWYGSFFADAPRIFETAQTLAERWPGAQRIFVWQDLGGQPSALPQMPGPVYVIARSGGKEIVSNQPTRP
jgi:hypothetical protein